MVPVLVQVVPQAAVIPPHHEEEAHVAPVAAGVEPGRQGVPVELPVPGQARHLVSKDGKQLHNVGVGGHHLPHLAQLTRHTVQLSWQAHGPGGNYFPATNQECYNLSELLFLETGFWRRPVLRRVRLRELFSLSQLRLLRT